MPDNEEKEEGKEIIPLYTPSTPVKFERKEKVSSQIPLASLPDIIFLLLLFFMASTVFKQYTGLPVELPAAKKIEKLPGKRNVSYIWVDRTENISVDDKLVDVSQIGSIMYQKRIENPRVIISLKIDRDAKMGIVADIQEQLREADALRINYSTRFAE